jgi:glutamate carboxypeptidase
MSEINRDQMQVLRDHFFSRQHELLALTCALVETESPSGDKEGSSAVVSLLASAAGSIGAVNSVERIASEDFGEHILIRAFANSDSESSLMILGHTDTVHPRGAIKERPWRTEGNRIYGPGVFDMKVNCALALEALRACEANDLTPKSPITIVLTCDEETWKSQWPSSGGSRGKKGSRSSGSRTSCQRRPREDREEGNWNVHARG